MQSIITPDWVKDAVFYQIFPDRFATSKSLKKPDNLEPWHATPTFHAFKGGDLVGLTDRLDYLQDLGITAIYLNPVFQSASNHRYHTQDYTRVDPLLGGNSALRTLLDAAHSRGMRVILDGVFNHASRGFFQFHHLLENGASSPYIDWFQAREFPLNAYDESVPPNYAAWWNLHALPKFNIDNPAVRDFLWDIGRHWIEFGIDGWRLDVPGEIDDDHFWREFRRRVKSANPDAYIVGEVWHEASRWLQGDQFDAIMNYCFSKACLGFFIRDHDWDLLSNVGYAPVPKIRAEGFADTIDELLALYHSEITAAQLNLLDSHDTARFISIARGDESALKLATLFQMTYPGAPCIYYGNEIGLEGGRDPDCRRGFPWDENQWRFSLRDFFKQCIALRHRFPALRRGEFTRLYAKDDAYIFGRRLGAETLIIALNNDTDQVEITFDVSAYLPNNTKLTDVWSNSTVTVNNAKLSLRIPRRSGLVMQSL